MNIKERQLEDRTGQKERLRKARKGTPAFFAVIAVIILTIASWDYVSFLDTQLFEERKSHIVEFADKASEIVDNVIEYSWQQVSVCEHLLSMDRITSDKELMQTLVSISSFIDKNNSIVLALDRKANYYSSDNHTGRWPQTEFLTDKMGAQQQITAEIPHTDARSYFVFMKRLSDPVTIGEEEITHLALAVDIEWMREKISVAGFGNQCYTYLVNADGRRLYKYTYTDNFIEGYNVLNAFKDYNIIHGGTYGDFVENMEQGNSTALEFEFLKSSTERQNWFVTNAPVSSAGWQLLLFVPTKVLGANSTLLMNRTMLFFGIVSAVLIGLTITVIVITMISKADRQLMRQKDEANQLLLASAEEARSANQAKSDFLSHMSHDIRTPINGIMGMTEIAIKNIGSQDKVLDCLHKISGSSQHLLGLINDVLDMSRIESGKTKINHKSFDIRTCIDNCISIIGGQLVTRDVQLIKEIDSIRHPLLIGDELHLRQVFINILGNSVKFTPDGGKIFFRAIETDSEAHRARFRFELEDTGIGMKEEFLPHLFDAFSQEDGGSRTTYKGTGLGMAITKKFLDLMGAAVEVKSRLNEGTKFIIELWIEIDKNGKPQEIQTGFRIDLKDMNILLAEDVELNLEIAQSILEGEGASITPAMNGQEAVDAFSSHPEGTFDAILMDIMMPVMDGITATKTIRALDRPDAKTIPIIAMTANAYEEDIRRTHEAGMNAHLSKPVDIDMLLKTMSHFYDMQKKHIQAVNLAGLKVLLADDAELNLEIAREMLNEVGAVVTMASDGQEAVDIFSGKPEGTFDIILMDVHMPVMDGLDAAKAIRAMARPDAKKIPILAMTADVYEEDVIATKEAGMNAHLTKPLIPEQLKYLLSEFNGNL